MADLDLITEFTGVIITSDQKLGTNNPTATLNPPCLTGVQRDALTNCTPYTDNGGTLWKIKPGTEIFNITTGTLEVLQGTPLTGNMGWVSLQAGAGAGNVTMAADAAAAGLVLESAANNKTVRATALVTANIPTMAANAADANTIIVSGGNNKTVVDSTISIANIPVNLTAGAAGNYTFSRDGGGTITLSINAVGVITAIT